MIPYEKYRTQLKAGRSIIFKWSKCVLSDIETLKNFISYTISVGDQETTGKICSAIKMTKTG